MTGRKNVKLPKIAIKDLNCDPIEWQQFKDLFEVTINNNESLRDAEKCIAGMSLSADDYTQVWEFAKVW